VKDYSKLDDKEKSYFQTRPDTAAIMKWTGRAVQQFPNSVSFWKARAGALKDAGKEDEALAAYLKIAELDRKDVVSRIAAVQILQNRIKIDSTVAIDTEKMKQVDQLLTQIAQASQNPTPQDTAIRMNVAVMYFTPATKMVQAKVDLDRS